MSANKDDSQQRAQPGARQPQGSGVHSNFAHASPESNVNPPGAPQSGAGSIAGSSGAEVPGGVTGQIQASRNAQSGKGASAAGGNPGNASEGGPADDGHSVVHSSGGAGMDRDS